LANRSAYITMLGGIPDGLYSSDMIGRDFFPSLKSLVSDFVSNLLILGIVRNLFALLNAFMHQILGFMTKCGGAMLEVIEPS
jgi:hypothetical protein